MMTMKDTRYDLWREYDPEDTVRFFALRLNELGMIKKSPERGRFWIYRLAFSQRDQARAVGEPIHELSHAVDGDLGACKPVRSRARAIPRGHPLQG